MISNKDYSLRNQALSNRKISGSESELKIPLNTEGNGYCQIGVSSKYPDTGFDDDIEITICRYVQTNTHD